MGGTHVWYNMIITSFPPSNKLNEQCISCMAHVKEKNALSYLKDTVRIFEVLYATGGQINMKLANEYILWKNSLAFNKLLLIHTACCYMYVSIFQAVEQIHKYNDTKTAVQFFTEVALC